MTMTLDIRAEARRREREAFALRQRREQHAADVRSVAGTPEGARLLAKLIRDGDIFRLHYQPGIGGAYQAGLRAAALALWRDLRDALPRDRFIDIALPSEADAPADYPEDSLGEVE